ncbi:hypothetical protein RDV84_25355 [Lysobacter yananisis]|uniref:Uncharacterized protein n=1 Tax=Lysobacter yananisis TaxID=1003114 RepID=A0ABY9P8L9_9GAMM|nr:hypothetical protein [Lysobacter yananisis]WMT03241.1 hypothetical protein RDV84_25355 [Lysobacter yananisis]
MNLQEYPHAVDCAWIGSDRHDRPAVFVTAGEGPIPAAALRADFFPVVEVEARVLRMGERLNQGVRVLAKVPDPGSYIRLARRGLFVYDWSDVTRHVGHTDAYELMAAPLNPILCSQLPEDLRTVARAVNFPGLAFADSLQVKVE